MGKKRDVKRNVLPHSKAKLDLYKSYLRMYLPILGHSIHVTAINVFDIFCGTGVYDDGHHGSPLIAASCIQDYELNAKSRKSIKLFINDFDKDKVSGVKELIGELKLESCQVEYFNLDASEMFKIVSAKVNSFPRSERSLVFIDPYGYSKIRREDIYNILQNKKTEIILFLPVAHMKRFTEGALTDLDNKAYENLRTFINEFLPDHSLVKRGVNLNVFDYIEELRKAFSFGNRFYTASHYIERDASNYYALFFVGSHIYGLEKFVEAKWANASLGKGFNQKDRQNTLFGDYLEEFDRHISIEHLKDLFGKLLESEGEVTNAQLYQFTLMNQFKISHMSEVIRDWHKSKKIQILNSEGKVVEQARGLGLTYENSLKKNNIYTFKKR